MSKRAQIGDCFTGAVIADDADEYPFISDPDILERSGQGVATWQLAPQYGFVDRDGSQPDWGARARDALGWDVD